MNKPSFNLHIFSQPGRGGLGFAPIAAAFAKLATPFWINAADLIYAAIHNTLAAAVRAIVVKVKIIWVCVFLAHPLTSSKPVCEAVVMGWVMCV
jgi:hypothetical protein